MYVVCVDRKIEMILWYIDECKQQPHNKCQSNNQVPPNPKSIIKMASSTMSLKSNVMKTMTGVYKQAMKEAIMSCSELYGFNGEEALSRMGVEKMTGVVENKSSKKEPRAAKVEKAKVPFPFEAMDESKCCALKANHGLYTQCQSLRKKENDYCGPCEKQCHKNESGRPPNGVVQERMNPEFKGPKGDAPKHFTAVMKKLKLSKEQVEEEAAKFGLTISEEHFIAPENATKRGRPSKKGTSDGESSSEPKKRGRPKKAAKEVQPEEVDDLFASLVSNVENDDDSVVETETSSLSGSEGDESESKASKKAAKKVESEELKAMKAAEKETKKAAADEAKAKKEAEKAAKKAAADDAKAKKEAETKAKKEAAEAEKAKKEAEKEALKQAKEAKKTAEEKEKADKKAALEAKKQVKFAAPAKSEAEPAPVALKVKKFEYKGTKYLRAPSTGVVYNMEQDEVGKWNEETNEIDFNAELEELEEEEEQDDA